MDAKEFDALCVRYVALRELRMDMTYATGDPDIERLKLAAEPNVKIALRATKYALLRHFATHVIQDHQCHE